MKRCLLPVAAVLALGGCATTSPQIEALSVPAGSFVQNDAGGTITGPFVFRVTPGASLAIDKE